jgi:hypothetical protein
MSSLLERYERQAVDLRPGRTYSPITDIDVMDDVAVLAGEERRGWGAITRALAAAGAPLALQGGIAGAEAKPPADALAALTFSASEQALWAAATYTPIEANSRSPVQYELYASGTITTVATPGTMTLTPRFGTSTGGGSLGPSNAVTLTASLAGLIWQLRGEVTVRGTGIGTARVYGTFHFLGKLATTGNGAADQNLLFGYTAVTNGSTDAAQGLFMGLTGSAATPTITVQQIKWGSWN